MKLPVGFALASVNRLHHLHSHSKCIDDAIECTYTWHDNAIFHLRDIGLGGVNASIELLVQRDRYFGSIIGFHPTFSRFIFLSVILLKLLI